MMNHRFCEEHFACHGICGFVRWDIMSELGKNFVRGVDCLEDVSSEKTFILDKHVNHMRGFKSSGKKENWRKPHIWLISVRYSLKDGLEGKSRIGFQILFLVFTARVSGC